MGKLIEIEYILRKELNFESKELDKLNFDVIQGFMEIHNREKIERRAFELSVHGLDPKKDEQVAAYNREIMRKQWQALKK